MEQYIVVIIFFLVALSLMLGSLKFSKYKERPGSTCGGDDCACEASGKEIGSCDDGDDNENKFVVNVDKM